jgi:hypothetical protein
MFWILLFFLLAYYIFEILILRAARINKNKTVFKTAAFSTGLFTVIFASGYIFNLNIPDYVFILLMLCFFLHSYFGHYKNYYNEKVMFDRILHMEGAFAFSLYFYYLFSNFMKYGGSKIFLAFYILLLGIASGAVYEIVEYFMGLNKSRKLQRGLRDTDFDIMSDIAGSAAAAVFAIIFIL